MEETGLTAALPTSTQGLPSTHRAVRHSERTGHGPATNFNAHGASFRQTQHCNFPAGTTPLDKREGCCWLQRQLPDHLPAGAADLSAEIRWFLYELIASNEVPSAVGANRT